jgi:hypothetical protein
MKRESAKVEKKESKKSSIRWAGFTAYTLGVFCLAFLVGMLFNRYVCCLSRFKLDVFNDEYFY